MREEKGGGGYPSVAAYSRKIFQVMVKWYISYSMVYHIKVTDETVCKENNCNNSYLLIIGHFVTFGCIQEPTSLL